MRRRVAELKSKQATMKRTSPNMTPRMRQQTSVQVRCYSELGGRYPGRGAGRRRGFTTGACRLAGRRASIFVNRGYKINWAHPLLFENLAYMESKLRFLLDRDVPFTE